MDENERLKCNKAFSKIQNFIMRVDNTYGINIHELKAQARKMKKIMALRSFSLTILA